MTRSTFKTVVAGLATAAMLTTLPLAAHASSPATRSAIDETAGVCNGAGFSTLNSANISNNAGQVIGQSRRNACNNDQDLQWSTVVSYIGTQRLHAEIYQDANSNNDQYRDCNDTGCTTPAIRVNNPSDATGYGYLTGPSGTVYNSNPLWV